MKKKMKILDEVEDSGGGEIGEILEKEGQIEKVEEVKVLEGEGEGEDVIVDEEEEAVHRKTPQPIDFESLKVESGNSIRKPSTPTFQSNTTSNRSSFGSLPAEAGGPFSRSIYIGNLAVDCSIRDICDLVRGDRGIESVRLLPVKACAFIDFITREGARRFFQRVQKTFRGRPRLCGQEIKLGWAKEKPLSPVVVKAIENGATRNVYLSFPATLTTDLLLEKFNDYLRDSGKPSVDDFFVSNAIETPEITDLKYPIVAFLYGIFDEFGAVDMVKVVPGRRIAFIHMAQVADAMRAVAELPTRPEFKSKKFAFGRDRCGERLGDNNTASAANSAGNASTATTSTNTNFISSGASLESFNSTSTYPSSVYTLSSVSATSASPDSPRTVYLGACSSPEITIEDICDQIHTGQLQSVRLNRERRCAFVTFISPAAAEAFLARALQFGLVIRNCQIKPAFAKENNNVGTDGINSSTAATSSNNTSNASQSQSQSHNHILPSAIVNALRKGYTRNLYLGNVDFSVLTESRLRTEMSHFGPLDRIQLLKDRGVAFVHFANLLDGGRAFEHVKSDVCYQNCRVGFGRDRCEPHHNINPAVTSNNTQQYQQSHMYLPTPLAMQMPMPPHYPSSAAAAAAAAAHYNYNNYLYYPHPSQMIFYDNSNSNNNSNTSNPSQDYPPVLYRVQSSEEYNYNNNNNNTTAAPITEDGSNINTNTNRENNNNHKSHDSPDEVVKEEVVKEEEKKK